LLSLLKKYPAPFDGLNQPMSQNRGKLIQKLREAGLETAAQKIQVLELEYFVLSPIYLLWNFTKKQTQLQQAFPDLLFADAPAFGEWLRQNASSHFLEPELANIFLQKAQGHSLARIFSFVNESFDFASQFPLMLVGQKKETCIRTLLGQLHFDRQFDLDDIVMYAWIMETKPWAGLSLTFELLPNACRQPSPLLPEGQEALLGPLLSAPGFQDALADYRAHVAEKKLDEMHARSHQHRVGVMSGWPYPRPEKTGKKGVNFFGFFKSPIGLGSLSHGLAQAFRSANIHVQKSVLNNASMEQDLRPEDFIRTYDYSLNTNLFLSYPHFIYRLLEIYPAEVVKGRKNIVYLAWEQRDGHPNWEQAYAEFDQVWALSHFAAESFRRYMKRDDVIAVPGVVDFESFPAPVTKQDVELNPDQFTFLYIFDASSSIERKNPEAAIRAFSQAFGHGEKVQLLLKVTNAHRLDCRQRLRRLAGLAAHSGMDIRFLMSNLPRPRLLKMISAVDCYVSLHRAEGFGYTCAEAMAYAKPVIATNYSGTTEFMDAKSAFLVDYKECEITAADGPFQRGSIWAEPSIEHAATQMREVYLNREAAEKIGLAGQVNVRQLLSAERVGKIAAAALAGKLKNGVLSR
jgi:glycosyltransferase involved in cell wall biosynthesis